jgi:DNA-binding LacI/PurR family transcriptional regulator
MPASVTIKDIARELNLSHVTVSRVLNNHTGGYTSLATRERIRETAARMGYRPNLMARALATGRTGLISVWVPRPYAPYYASILMHLRRRLREDGYSILISDTFEGGVGNIPVCPLNELPADGIIAVDGYHYLARHLQHDARLRLPVVNMGTGYSEQTDSVGLNQYSASVEAVRHLGGQGCRRIAYLTVDNGLPDARRSAYAAVVEELGLSPEYIFVSEETRLAARTAVTEHLQQVEKPFDGLFCRNDDLAVGAYRALRDAGLRVPADVALVGCDGIEETEYHDPTFSTINKPVEEMCDLAWRYLQQRIADPDIAQQHIVLPAHFVVRESSSRTQPAKEGTPP